MTKETLLNDLKALDIANDQDITALKNLLTSKDDSSFKNIQFNRDQHSLYDRFLEENNGSDFDNELINDIKRIAAAKLLNLNEVQAHDEDKLINKLDRLPKDLTTLYTWPLSTDVSSIFSKPNPENEDQELAIRILQQLVMQGDFVRLLMTPTKPMSNAYMNAHIDSNLDFLKLLLKKTGKFNEQTINTLFSPEKVDSNTDTVSYLNCQKKLLSFFEALQANPNCPVYSDVDFVENPCHAALTLDFLKQSVSQKPQYLGNTQLINQFDNAVNLISKSHGIQTSVNVRGDGNCYYRTVMIGLLEQMVVAENRVDLFNNLAVKLEASLKNPSPLVHLSDDDHKRNQEALIATLKKAAQGNCWNSPQDLKRDLLISGEGSLDYTLVRAARYLVAQRIESLKTVGKLNENFVIEGVDLNDDAQRSSYYQSKILSDGEYAKEDTMCYHFLSDSLGVPIQLMDLKESSDDVKLTKYPVSGDSSIEPLDSKTQLKVNVLLFRNHTQILRSTTVHSKISEATQIQNKKRLDSVKTKRSEPEFSLGFVRETNTNRVSLSKNLPEFIQETKTYIISVINELQTSDGIIQGQSIHGDYKQALNDLKTAKAAYDASSYNLKSRGVLTWVADRLDRPRAEDAARLMTENTRLKTEYETKLKRENELYLARNRYDALKQQLDVVSVNPKDITEDDTLLREKVEAAKAMSEYIALIPSILARRDANVAFKERTDDSIIKTRLVYNVKNREAEAKAAMDKNGKPTQSADENFVEAATGEGADKASEPVVYRHEHLKQDDIIQTVGLLPQGSMLYIEKDHENTVCNRSRFKANCNEDVIDAAFEQAELILSHYHEKSGPITITAKGKLGDMPSDEFAGILHAALLVLGKDMHYLQIRSTVRIKPQAGWLYGENKEAFIKQQLLKGVDKAQHQEKLQEYGKKHKSYASTISEMRAREQAARQDNKPLEEGAQTEINNKPKL